MKINDFFDLYIFFFRPFGNFKNWVILDKMKMNYFLNRIFFQPFRLMYFNTCVYRRTLFTQKSTENTKRRIANGLNNLV